MVFAGEISPSGEEMVHICSKAPWPLALGFGSPDLELPGVSAHLCWSVFMYLLGPQWFNQTLLCEAILWIGFTSATSP